MAHRQVYLKVHAMSGLALVSLPLMDMRYIEDEAIGK